MDYKELAKDKNFMRILRTANEEYPDGYLDVIWNDLKTGREPGGDSLALFIVNEMAETFDPEARPGVQVAEARRVIDRGIADMRGSLEALDDLQTAMQ